MFELINSFEKLWKFKSFHQKLSSEHSFNFWNFTGTTLEKSNLKVSVLFFVDQQTILLLNWTYSKGFYTLSSHSRWVNALALIDCDSWRWRFYYILITFFLTENSCHAIKLARQFFISRPLSIVLRSNTHIHVKRESVFSFSSYFIRPNLVRLEFIIRGFVSRSWKFVSRDHKMSREV